jgi:hypothetical protein
MRNLFFGVAVHLAFEAAVVELAPEIDVIGGIEAAVGFTGNINGLFTAAPPELNAARIEGGDWDACCCQPRVRKTVNAALPDADFIVGLSLLNPFVAVNADRAGLCGSHSGAYQPKKSDKNSFERQGAGRKNRNSAHNRRAKEQTVVEVCAGLALGKRLKKSGLFE